MNGIRGYLEQVDVVYLGLEQEVVNGQQLRSW